MTERYWLRCTRRQLLYIIEGCQIDMPLVEHWSKRRGKGSLAVQGDGQMRKVITSLERNARDALYRGPDTSQYPPGHKKRHLKVKH